MDPTTRTCNICIKKFYVKNINKFYAHMKKHLIPEYDHLFSKKDIEIINKAHNNLQLSYVRQRNNYICKICDKKFINNQIKICHMKIHLKTKERELFSQEEIKLIEIIHSHRTEIKKRSKQKSNINNATNQPTTVPPLIPISPLIPVPDLIPISALTNHKLPVPDLIPIWHVCNYMNNV